MDVRDAPAAVILAAGAGSRLGPLGQRYSKPMVPLLGRPLIRWIGERLATAACPPCCVVAHPDDRPLLEELARWTPPPRVVFQRERRGSADALACVAPAVSHASLLLVAACDSLFPVDDLRCLLAEGVQHQAAAALAVCATDRAAVAARSAVTVEGGLVTDIVEKPDPGTVASKIVGLPLYLLPRRALALAAIEPPSVRGERELSDVIRRLIAEGVPVHWVQCGRFEVTTPTDVLRVSLLLLEEGGFDRVPPALRGARRRYLPPVVVQAGAQVGSSARLGPRVFVGRDVRVGAGAVLEDAVVFGPVEIAPGTRIQGALRWA